MSGKLSRSPGACRVIVKLIRGTQGHGVFLVSNIQTVEEIARTLQRVNQQMLVQEFIKESEGSDIRVIVVGNRCIAAMKRTAVTGEFRSNLHRGGSAEAITLDLETRQLASNAAQAHGLSVAGVDLVQSNRGPLLLEVNSSPGLEGIEKSTKIDVAGEIISYLEREERKVRHSHHNQRRKKSRRR